MNKLIVILLSILVFSCTKHDDKEKQKKATSQFEVLEEGKVIKFQKLPEVFTYFTLNGNSLDGEFEAPAQVAASVLKKSDENSEVIILFDDTELTDLYAALLQNIAHYNRDKEYCDRVEDMNENGAATGKELLEAKTGVIEAATELAEKEARFQISGFEPRELRKAKPGIVWIIANVSESALSDLEPGKPCAVEFISYPGERFYGNVSAIGEVLDNSSQTIKVRVTLQNRENKFKPGMFATVRFGIKKGNKLAVPQGAIITAQGKNFVFKKEGNTFSRTEVEISNQINDYIEIKSGIHSKDTIVTKGSMLLKGLSFGY